MSLPDNELLEMVGLCNALEDGMITVREKNRLFELLESSENARQFYVKFMDLSASLQCYGAEMQSEIASVAKPSTRMRRVVVIGLAAAAAITLAAIVFWKPWRQPDMGGVGIEVVSSNGVPFTKGEHFFIKRLNIAQGELRFRLASGAVVDIDGPAVVDLLDPMRVRVITGSLTADVGDDAKGFVVETVNARVVDLGTRFGVSFDDAGETDVVVFEGEVEVHDPVAGSQVPVTELSEGEALRVDATSTTRRLSAVALRGDSRALLGSSGRKKSVVSNVSDNIIESGYRRYYSILPAGMKEGGRPYPVVRKARWLPQVGQKFPNWLVGADLIGAFSRDRKDLNHQITLDVAGHCQVFVMPDVRNEPPDWMRRDFHDTGVRLRTGPWPSDSPVASRIEPDHEGKLYLTHAVWSREVVHAGSVILGPPRGKDEPIDHAMYGIAVKDLR